MVLRFWFFEEREKSNFVSEEEDASNRRMLRIFRIIFFLEIFFRIHAGHVVVIVIVIVNKIHVGSSKILLLDLEGGLFHGVCVVFIISVVMFGGSADGHFFGIGRPLFGLYGGPLFGLG